MAESVWHRETNYLFMQVDSQEVGVGNVLPHSTIQGKDGDIFFSYLSKVQTRTQN